MPVLQDLLELEVLLGRLGQILQLLAPQVLRARMGPQDRLARLAPQVPADLLAALVRQAQRGLDMPVLLAVRQMPSARDL